MEELKTVDDGCPFDRYLSSLAAIAEKTAPEIVIIGAGLSGFWVLLEVLKKYPEATVTIIERGNDVLPLESTSQNQCGKLHTGIHYLKDLETAKKCLLNLVKIAHEYPEFILDKDNPAAVTRNGQHHLMENSLCSPNEARETCRQLIEYYRELLKEYPNAEAILGRPEDFIEITSYEDNPLPFYLSTEPIHNSCFPHDPESKTSVALTISTREPQLDLRAVKKKFEEMTNQEKVSLLINTEAKDTHYSFPKNPQDRPVKIITKKFNDSAGEEKIIEADYAFYCNWQEALKYLPKGTLAENEKNPNKNKELTKNCENKNDGIQENQGVSSSQRTADLPDKPSPKNPSYEVRGKVSVVIKCPEPLKAMKTFICGVGPYISITQLPDGLLMITVEDITNIGRYNQNGEVEGDLLFFELYKSSLSSEGLSNLLKNAGLGEALIARAAEYVPALKNSTPIKILFGYVIILENLKADYLRTVDSPIHAREDFGVVPSSLYSCICLLMKMTYGPTVASLAVKTMKKSKNMIKNIVNHLTEKIGISPELKSDLLMVLENIEQYDPDLVLKELLNVIDLKTSEATNNGLKEQEKNNGLKEEKTNKDLILGLRYYLQKNKSSCFGFSGKDSSVDDSSDEEERTPNKSTSSISMTI